MVMPNLEAFFHSLLLVAVGAFVVLGSLAVFLVGRLAHEESGPDGPKPSTEGRAWWACPPSSPGCAPTRSDLLSERERAARLLEVQPTASRPVVEAAYKKLAVRAHPDHGGDADLMRRLNAARDLLLQPR
jgi:DnaJ homolog subfamily C member 19